MNRRRTGTQQFYRAIKGNGRWPFMQRLCHPPSCMHGAFRAAVNSGISILMTAELHALLQRHLAACECAATLLSQVISFDVKPGNILLDITKTIAKLSDMGLAKLQTQSLNTLVSWNKMYAWLMQQILSSQHGVLLWAM